jgi:hypothetical protein
LVSNPRAFLYTGSYRFSTGPDGSFPGLLKTDSFGLGRDLYERSTGDVVGTCFLSTKEILDLNVYDKLSDSMFVGVGAFDQMLTRLPEIKYWFDLNFKDKKPTVQVRILTSIDPF